MRYIIGNLTGENCLEPTDCGIVLCSDYLHFSPVEAPVSITMSYHLATVSIGKFENKLNYCKSVTVAMKL